MGLKTDFGRLRANPQARDTNFIKLDNSCSCTPGSACLDTIVKTVAANTTFNSMVYFGETFTPTAPIPVSDTQAIEDFICSVLLKREFDVIVTVKLDGTTLTITHIGQGVIGGITYSNGAGTVTRLCDTAVICEYKSLVVGDVSPLGDGTTSQALANTPYAYSGTTATDDATAATLKDDIESALLAVGIPYISTEVTVNVLAEAYEVSIKAVDGTKIYFGTKQLVACNCEEAFITAP